MNGKRRVETVGKYERLPRDVSEAQVDAAEGLLRELLAEGPRRPCDVKAIALERGIVVAENAWSFARRRIGASSNHLGANVWCWAVGGIGDVEAEFAQWLATPCGRFAEFYAERRRREVQLALDLELES
jgi:hypothetical protein